MHNHTFLPNHNRKIFGEALSNFAFPRQAMIGVILLIALLAFELFNFDSTRFALDSLLGSASFLGITWAAILAVAFCAIDFAGLARIFTPEQGMDEPREIWYLTGAWFLGATMNAIMTWWAVSLVLLNHSFGNEVLNRQQLLEYVPIFVAVLVWLTRILFIGAFAVAGDRLFKESRSTKRPVQQQTRTQQSRPASAPSRSVVPAPMAAASATNGSNQNSGGLPQRPPVRNNQGRPAPMTLSPQRKR